MSTSTLLDCLSWSTSLSAFFTLANSSASMPSIVVSVPTEPPPAPVAPTSLELVLFRPFLIALISAATLVSAGSSDADLRRKSTHDRGTLALMPLASPLSVALADFSNSIQLAPLGWFSSRTAPESKSILWAGGRAVGLQSVFTRKDGWLVVTEPAVRKSQRSHSRRAHSLLPPHSALKITSE